MKLLLSSIALILFTACNGNPGALVGTKAGKSDDEETPQYYGEANSWPSSCTKRVLKPYEKTTEMKASCDHLGFKLIAVTEGANGYPLVTVSFSDAKYGLQALVYESHSNNASPYFDCTRRDDVDGYQQYSCVPKDYKLDTTSYAYSVAKLVFSGSPCFYEVAFETQTTCASNSYETYLGDIAFPYVELTSTK